MLKLNTILKEVRKAAILNFLDSTNIDTIEKLTDCMNVANKKMLREFASIQQFLSPRISKEEVLIDELVLQSFERKNDRYSWDRISTLIRQGLSFAANQIYSELCITYKSGLTFQGYNTDDNTGKVTAIVLETVNVPRTNIKTPLDKDVAIISKEDRISDVLYEISLKIKATDYLIAVGYAYDSGLELLAPALMSVRYNADTTEARDERRAELVVGSLQHYDGKTKIKQMSRASAQRINDFKTSICIKKLYTCPKQFYHGKFYYISSDSEAYVIMGSSNITKPAFEKNYEFDVIYHFNKNDDLRMLEQQFLNWYNELVSHCVEIFQLDESLFPSTVVQDENGSGSKTSFYRSLESEEERERYNLLERYSPSRISEFVFKGQPYRAFKKYILFEYAARGISILEGFSYGNSCYILSMVKEDEIKEKLKWKSKEQVREQESFITNIQHDLDYNQKIESLFERYPECQ